MRRLGWFLVVLVLLAGLAYGADVVLRDAAEDRVAAEVDRVIPGVAHTPDVTIEGFPFLTQVVAGELDSVRLDSAAANVQGLRLQDVVVRLQGVTVESPYRARTAELTALVTPVAAKTALGLTDLDLTVRSGELLAGATVLGLPLDVALTTRVEGSEVVVDVEAFVLGGVRVEATDLPAEITAQVQDLRFAVNGLPANMRLTGVTVVDGGVEIAATGHDIELSAAG